MNCVFKQKLIFNFRILNFKEAKKFRHRIIGDVWELKILPVSTYDSMCILRHVLPAMQTTSFRFGMLCGTSCI